VVDARGRQSYFVLTYDVSSEQVLGITGHGPDFVGAVLALSASMDQHRDQPGVIVRLLAATSVADLVERHADLFGGLRLPD
jgi:hypothetical protein